MRPLRVLFPYVGDTVGGSHVSSLALVRALPRDRVTPVVARHRAGLVDGWLAGQGFAALAAPDVPLPRVASPLTQAGRFVAGFGPLLRFLRAEAIDIVHTNDLRMHLAWLLPAWRAGAAQVWHQRTPTRSRRLGFYARPAAAVVTVSDWCRGELAPRLRARAEVVPNPVGLTHPPDRAAARARIAAAMGARADGPVVGYVANLAPRKAPEVFVAAAALLARRHPDALFPMIGEAREPLGPAIAAAIEAAGLGGRCALLGPRFPAEDWLAGFDVLLVPARGEGFGRTLVEAMLCGAAVVAADEAGHRGILVDGATGRLVAPGDPAAYAGAAAALLADPDARRAMADRAQAEAAAAYAPETHAARILAIYERIAGARR